MPPHAEAAVRADALATFDRLAAERGIASNDRIGVPDTKLLPGKASRVGGKLTATRVAKRPMARVARPGRTLPSQTSVGTPRARAASTSGSAR